MKDIAMANDSGVDSVLAEYGHVQSRDQYDLLKKVTHWTKKDVAREALVNSREDVVPRYRLKATFAELLQHFEFSDFIEAV